MNKGNELESDTATGSEQAYPLVQTALTGDTAELWWHTGAVAGDAAVNADDAAAKKSGSSDTPIHGEDVEFIRAGSGRRFTDYLKLSHGPDLPRSHAAIDLLVTIFCFAAVHLMYLGSLNFTSDRTLALYGSLVFLITFLFAGGIYGTKRLRSLNGELTILVICWMCAFAALGLFAFLTAIAEDVSRVWITSSMLVTLVSLTLVRMIGSLGFLAKGKVKSRNVIVCGNASSVRAVLRSLHKAPNSGIRVAKVFEFSSHQSWESQTSKALQRSADEITRFVENQRQIGAAVEQVWIAVSENQSQVTEILSKTLINSPVDVCVAPDHFTERLLTGDVTRFGETKIVNISEISISPTADQFKRVFDVVIASAALLLLFIPMAIIASLIKLETPGPVLFRQKRYGIDGREIEVLKFRSMHVHSDTRVRQATKNDARVTRLGKLLRSSSLDELPQLLNVLSGTMSLIGPRPHAVAHNEMWRRQIKGYMLRHKVRPGITGLAQVKGWRGETDTPFKMQQRVKYDLEYIKTWSPWLDIKILLLTVVKGFRNENAY